MIKIISQLIIFYLFASFNIFGENSESKTKPSFFDFNKNAVIYFSLGKSLVQNDLNDSRNQTYYDSMHYLIASDSRFIKDIHKDKFYENKELNEQENSSIKQSKTTLSYGFDFFNYENYSLGLGLNTQSVSIQRSFPFFFGPNGGSDLLIFYYKPELFNGYPLQKITFNRNISNYYLSFGKIFYFFDNE